MAVLLTFNSRVLNYIYFTQVIRPSIILQDKNLTDIYFDWPKKELNYKLCFQNLFNSVKFEKWSVDFYAHWKNCSFFIGGGD
jgi:hypothetical protein